MFLTVACFFMMLSCLRILEQDKTGDGMGLVLFFRKRLTDPRFSDWWKVVFFCLKYIQTVLLMILFLKGISNINNVQNLGYMLFFVVYTAYEEAYRRTSILLIIFNASFIIMQYLFSFMYPLVADDQETMEGRYKWLNLYPPTNPSSDPFLFKEKGNEDMYFKISPQAIDWTVVVLLNLLSIVNDMFKQKKEIIKLTELTSLAMKDKYERAIYYYGRVERIIKSLLIFAILILMIYMQSTIEISIINWVFFVLNTINFAFIIRGTKDVKFVRQSLCITNFIKAYSLLIIAINLLFISFIGETEKVGHPDSLDQKFKRAYPLIYKSLDIIGLRGNRLVSSERSLQDRFIAYTIFFLLSIYLTNYFKDVMVKIKAD